MHRFALTAVAARKTNGRIATEAHLAPWLSLGGVKRSNVGGFHSHEQAFRSAGKRQPLGAWYGYLLETVLMPALRVLDGAQPPATIRYEDQALLEPRISGWLNASGEHDFNRLHTHGKDVTWSLVYYVDPGQPQQTDSCAQADGGALLIKVRPTSAATAADEAVGQANGPMPAQRAQDDEGSGTEGCGGYYTIHPAAGELWAFPGDTLHCVMPRTLPKQPRAGSLSLPLPLGLSFRLPWLEGGRAIAPRISVACNVYTVTSAHRDELIGFHEEVAGPLFGGDVGCAPWPPCAAARKPAKKS